MRFLPDEALWPRGSSAMSSVSPQQELADSSVDDRLGFEMDCCTTSNALVDNQKAQ